MAKSLPYKDWPQDKHQRWIAMGNTFGRHFMKEVVEPTYKEIPKTITPEAREAVKETIFNGFARLMAFLDGVPLNHIDRSNGVQYALMARVYKRRDDDMKTIEEFELAPDGDGLGMGFHGWAEGDFGKY